ncbi:MAG TPA: hypothetical protein VJ505_00080 [Holophagaceae bacterium]|nr:hypothetical protein [Holophagaceae bacterium]
MRFLPEGSLELRLGRFLDQGKATVLVDDQGWVWAPAKVKFVVPDDESMAHKARALGFAIHTPLSVHLME